MRVILSLVLLLTICSSYSNAFSWEHVKSTTIEREAYRSVSYNQLEILPGCPAFWAHGISVNGSIVDDIDVDTSVFKFTTCNLLKTSFPSYFFRFFSFSKNDDDNEGSGSIGASGSVSVGSSGSIAASGSVSVGEESSNNDDGEGAQVSKVAASFTPTFIIEYLEKNGKEGFQYKEDEILNYVNLAKLKYTMTKEQKDMTGNNGKNFTAYQMQVSSTNDLFQMTFYVSGAPINVGDVKLSAEQSKVDITINGFFDAEKNKKDCPLIQIGNYSCASSGTGSSNTESKIALTSFFATKSKNLEVSIDDNQIKINDEVIKAGFSWESNVVIDDSGKDKTVKVTSTSNSYVDFDDFGAAFIKRSFIGEFSAQFMTYTFERSNKIVWDPRIGGSNIDVDVDVDEESSSSHLMYSSCFVLISLILSLLV